MAGCRGQRRTPEVGRRREQVALGSRGQRRVPEIGRRWKQVAADSREQRRAQRSAEAGGGMNVTAESPIGYACLKDIMECDLFCSDSPFIV